MRTKKSTFFSTGMFHHVVLKGLVNLLQYIGHFFCCCLFSGCCGWIKYGRLNKLIYQIKEWYGFVWLRPKRRFFTVDQNHSDRMGATIVVQLCRWLSIPVSRAHQCACVGNGALLDPWTYSITSLYYRNVRNALFGYGRDHYPIQFQLQIWFN